MYLNFKGGEIIRVHVRDASGWWDGEIGMATEVERRDGPRRGWFPSNYVREMGWDGVSRLEADTTCLTGGWKQSLHRLSESASQSMSTTASVPLNHSRQASSTASQRSGTSTSASLSAPRAVSPTSRSPTKLSPALQAFLHPIVQSLSLLESAIHSNRKLHIQPSTACVISSIRSALMQTDCLSKESTVLTSFPVLAKERKLVLVELSKLVGCARTASGLDAETADDEKEMDALAKAARGVFASVKRFLHLANDCGVKPVPLPAEEGASVDWGRPTTPTWNTHPPTALDMEATNKSRIRQTSDASGRMQAAFRLKAASIGDLRAARRRASSPPPAMPVAQDDNLQHKARGRSPSAASTPMSATFASSSGSGRSSPVSTNKSMRDRRLQGSIDNASFHSHAASSDLGHPWEPSTPVPVPPAGLINRQLGSTPDVHDAISLAEDTLLSIIAAFIGHIHSHHIGSHPSSHAHLIEMTRETIDAVRELLTIVEAVGRNVGVRLSRPRDIENLRQAKDGLYDVASRLVEGAEEVANAPFSETGEDASDSEKARLLQTATGTLRAGTECVRLVKLCLPDEDTLNIQNTPRQSDEHAHQSTPLPAQDAAVVSRDKVVDVRGEHTLSARMRVRIRVQRRMWRPGMRRLCKIRVGRRK